jgi:membrane protein YdbS with pleckstrin-like domain
MRKLFPVDKNISSKQKKIIYTMILLFFVIVVLTIILILFNIENELLIRLDFLFAILLASLIVIHNIFYWRPWPFNKKKNDSL